MSKPEPFFEGTVFFLLDIRTAAFVQFLLDLVGNELVFARDPRALKNVIPVGHREPTGEHGSLLQNGNEPSAFVVSFFPRTRDALLAFFVHYGLFVYSLHK